MPIRQSAARIAARFGLSILLAGVVLTSLPVAALLVKAAINTPSIGGWIDWEPGSPPLASPSQGNVKFQQGQWARNLDGSIQPDGPGDVRIKSDYKLRFGETEDETNGGGGEWIQQVNESGLGDPNANVWGVGFYVNGDKSVEIRPGGQVWANLYCDLNGQNCGAPNGFTGGDGSGQSGSTYAPSDCFGSYDTGDGTNVGPLDHGEAATSLCSEGGSVRVTCVAGVYVASGACAGPGSGDGGE